MKKPKPKNAKTTKTPQPNAKALYGKGEASLASLRFDRARDFFEKALEAFRKAGDPQDAGQCLLKLGRTLELTGEYTQAREAYEESSAVFRGLGDRLNLARSKTFLGNIGWDTGDYAGALRLFDEALFLFKEAGDVPGQAWVNDLIGNIKLALREDYEAERFYRTAYSLVEEKGATQENRAWSQYHLGAVAFFRGDLLQAEERLLDAFNLFTRLKDTLGQVAALTHLGEIACDQKNYPMAEKYLQKAVQQVIPTHCMPLLSDALVGVARLLKGQGDERKALSLLMVALSHPTCRQQTKDRMMALSVTLKAWFSAQELKTGFDWAKAIPMETIATAWAASVSIKGKGKKNA